MASSFEDSELTRLFARRAGSGTKRSRTVITSLASKLRRTARCGTAADLLEKLRQKRGVAEVVYLDNLRCDGFLEPRGRSFSDGFRVFINPSLPAVRRNFTLAHELCHTFFYEYVPEIKFTPHETDRSEESLCNLGAGEILMPSAALTRRAKALPTCLRSLEELAVLYEVSTDAMLTRLRVLKLWGAELSYWTLLMNGRFAVERVTAVRNNIEWRWVEENIPAKAWETGQTLSGITAIEGKDHAGRRYVRELSFEMQRRSNRLVVLWGPSVKPSSSSLPLLTMKRPS